MLRSALATPTDTDDAAGVFIVGTLVTLLAWTIPPIWLLASALAPPLLVLAPLALAPAIVARGYFVRVIAEGVSDGNAGGAPSFVEWGRLYRDGLKSLLLSAVLLLPLVGLLALGVAAGVVVELDRVDPAPILEGVAGTAAGDSEATAAILALVGGLVGVLSAGYLVAFAYVRPAALALFADSGRLRDGLHPGRVAAVAFSGDYAVGWTLAMITLLTGYALAAPFVPLVVGIGVVFSTRIVAHSLYGRGASTALPARSGTRDEGARRGDEGARTGGEHARTRDGARRGDEGTLTARRDAGTGVVSGRPRSHRIGRIDEASPAVQTGRSVPLTGTGTERNPHAERNPSAERVADGLAIGADDETGFDWGPPIEDG